MQTNFILTSGALTPQYRRALKSASVHGLPVVLWHCKFPAPDVTGLDVEVRWIHQPEWLRPQNQPHVYDVLAYKIGYEVGGLVLGLDTISVRSAADLFNYCRDDCEVIVSTDWADGDSNCGMHNGVRQPYNNNFICRKGSELMLAMSVQAHKNICYAPEVWGYTGPLLLTEFMKDPRMGAAPYPALCGWSPGYVWRFYLGLEAPDPNTRVIHLCRSAYLALYEWRWQEWADANPGYADSVARRTPINAELLRCP